MRCSCQVCGTYMVHSESLELGCVCPQCLARCKACLGTDTVVSRDALKRLKEDPVAVQMLFEENDEPYEERFNPDEYGRE